MSYAANPRAPRDDREIEEGTGQITSDSLAAESIRSGGDFAGDRNVQPGSVPSRATTANVTDDSSATRLPAARDRTERLSDDPSYDPTGPAGYETAYRPDDNEEDSSYGRNGYTNASEQGDSSYDTRRGGPQYSDAGAAPNAYQADLYKVGDDEGKYVPKGRNISEGGFDDSAPNASFNSMGGEPGSRKDPGRLGLQQAERTNAKSAFDAGYEGSGNPRDTSDESGFDRLRRDEDA